MAIYPPGQKFRHSKILSRKEGKRGVVVTLSLTAMVDMFTVLVIFLLQNYNTTGEVLYIPKEVSLPKAEKVKDLKPAVVVTISNMQILVDKDQVATFKQVKEQQDWLIAPLELKVRQAIAAAKVKFESKLPNRIQNVMKGGQSNLKDLPAELPEWNKVTIQSDRGIDFMTIKKVLFTVTEAGAGEINFAVLKEKR